jgi:hypothetical protein
MMDFLFAQLICDTKVHDNRVYKQEHTQSRWLGIPEVDMLHRSKPSGPLQIFEIGHSYKWTPLRKSVNKNPPVPGVANKVCFRLAVICPIRGTEPNDLSR